MFITTCDEIKIDLLGLNIPANREGAMETFLLEALEKQEVNGFVARKSCEFVTELEGHKDELGPFLSKRRLCVKAPMAVFFAITNPERAFHPFEDILLSVPWEKYNNVNETFALLDRFKMG